jgi:hypothetical protein
MPLCSIAARSSARLAPPAFCPSLIRSTGSWLSRGATGTSAPRSTEGKRPGSTHNKPVGIKILERRFCGVRRPGHIGQSLAAHGQEQPPGELVGAVNGQGSIRGGPARGFPDSFRPTRRATRGGAAPPALSSSSPQPRMAGKRRQLFCTRSAHWSRGKRIEGLRGSGAPLPLNRTAWPAGASAPARGREVPPERA